MHLTSTSRFAMVAVAGVDLSLVHYFAITEFGSLAGSNELVVLIALGAYFLGLSLGYLVSDRISPRDLTVVGLCTLAFYATLPFSVRWLAGTLWHLGWRGMIPPLFFLTVLLGTTPFYALFLPRFIDDPHQEMNPSDSPVRERRIVRLYATELGGSLLGLGIAVALTPARMRYVLAVHLAGLVVLVVLWLGSRRRRLAALLAPLPIAYLLLFPALDRASLAYFYRQRIDLAAVTLLASEFSPYQRVDIFEGKEGDRTLTYLYLNGNLLYGTGALSRHNLFVSILPNLMVPHPSNALVIGGGSLDSARYLAPRVGHLRVVELDEAVVRLSRRTIQEPRGQFPTNWDLIIDDGKHFLGNYQGPPFDVISIDVPVPTYLQTATLHSDRFFALARTRLAPGGVFSISLSGTYSAHQRADDSGPSHLSSRVMAGLLQNFAYVTVVLGDGRAFAWASDTPLALPGKYLEARAWEFIDEAGAQEQFGRPPVEVLDQAEARSRAAGFAPIGEADMHVVFRLSLNKLFKRFYGTGD